MVTNCMSPIGFLHRVGEADCRIHCIRDMVEFLGLQLSLEMCFGLGEGLGFSYWQETNTKIPMLVILGRNIEAEQRLCQNLGIDMLCHKETDSNVAEAQLIENILNGYPSMLDVDRYYLPHLYELFDRNHFGLHAVIVTNYNTDEGSFGLYDFTSSDIIWCPADALSEARGSVWQPFPPENKWYEFNLREEPKINRSLIFSSIKNVCSRMLGQQKFIGVNAIRSFANDIALFKNYLRGGFVNSSQRNKFNRYIELQINFAARYISEIEPTGTMFRSVYANFLKEITETFEISVLDSMSTRLDEIALSWRDIADIAHLNIDLIEKLMLIQNNLKSVADIEERFFSELLARIDEN